MFTRHGFPPVEKALGPIKSFALPMDNDAPIAPRHISPGGWGLEHVSQVFLVRGKK